MILPIKIFGSNPSTPLHNWWIDIQLTREFPILSINKNDNTDFTTFHFYSHGRPGQLLIEGKWLNQSDLAVYFSKLITSTEIKHLNIYGCEFAKGEKGLTTVKYLENKLGISVSASTNITGKDGDWKLEVGHTMASISLPDFNANLQYGAGSCMGAQTVTMNFNSVTNPPVITGTPNTVGSTYKYSNVLQGSGVTQQVDAVFTLNNLNFGSSTIQQSVNFQFDVPASTIGIENNFQPSFIGSTLNPYPALGTYVLFQQWTVNFYLAGTTTPANLPIIVQVYDNDGTTSSYYINEIITFNTPPSSIVTSSAGATPTTETVNGNTVTSDNTTQSGIGTGLQYMVYAYYASVSSFQITIKDSIQFTNPSTTWGSRYHSFIIGCQNPGLIPLLPVKLLKFDAQNIDCKVNMLNWVTATEVNSEFFEIERSEDGKNFELIGKVEAAHNSTTNRSYQFKDNNTKSAFYRLKMVNIDKSFEYSEIIFLNSCSLEIGTLSPNPATTEMNLELKAEYPREVTVSIFNALGQLVLSLPKQQLNNGQNNILINVNELPNSTYFLKVDADNIPYFMAHFVKVQ